MRRTRLGILLLALGWSGFALALVFRTIAPAVLGAFLVALQLSARPPTPSILVSRQVPARVVALEPFEVLVEATDKSGALLFVEEILPPGVKLLAREGGSGRGTARLRLQLAAEDPGSLRWRTTHVRFQDEWGVLEGDVRVSAPGLTEVAPPAELVARGRRVGEHMRPITLRARKFGLESEPEIERLRDHIPGDRLRDIDWAHTSRVQKLITREMKRETELPLVVLLHAGRSMRRRRRHNKLATCARLALALLAASETRGMQAGLVAWSERGVEAQARVASAHGVVPDALRRLAAMPEVLPFHERDAARAEHLVRPLTAEERAFIAKLTAYGARTATTPTEAALAALTKVTTQPSLVVAFLDVEDSPQLAGAILSRLARHGHRAIVIAPANGAHHYERGEIDDERLDLLLNWRRNRDEATTIAHRYKADVVVVPPEISDRDLREVISSVR